MNLACWNIRGLHLPHKQDEIRSLVHVNKVSIIGILETKVKRKSSRKDRSPGRTKFLLLASKTDSI